MTKAEQRQSEQQLEEVKKQMWDHLKGMSKKALMRLILEQSDFIIDAQRVNRQLFEENKKLKEPQQQAPVEALGEQKT